MPKFYNLDSLVCSPGDYLRVASPNILEAVSAATLFADVASYAIGTWVPVLTFATPGDLVVAYAVRNATYTKIGRLVVVSVVLATSTFTHTTALGELEITGLPFTVDPTASNLNHMGAMNMQGITKATYTNFAMQAMAGTTLLKIAASASGVAASTVTFSDAPTGTTKIFDATVAYHT